MSATSSTGGLGWIRVVCGLLCLSGCGPAWQDNDEDGYSPKQGDCDDDDPARHPGVTEVCNRIDDDCDGTFDEGAAITPLPPGEYGVEAAVAVFHGNGEPGGLFNGALWTLGDVGGDGVDDFYMATNDQIGYVFHAGFCPGEWSVEDAGAVIRSGGPYPTGRLGDLNGDGVADLLGLGGVWLGPLFGEIHEPDILLPVPANVGVAARLGGSNAIDLVVVGGYSNTDQASYGSLRFYAGPITSQEDLPEPEVLLNNRPNSTMGMSMFALHSPGAPDVVVASHTNFSPHVVVALDHWPGSGDVTTDELLVLPPALQEEVLAPRVNLSSDGADRACIGAWGRDPESEPDGGPGRVVCGSIDAIADGDGRVYVEDWDLGYLANSQSANTASYTVLGHHGAYGAARVWGPEADDVWTFQRGDMDGYAGFGKGVAVSENTGGDFVWLLVSAPSEDDARGKIYVFALEKR